MCVRAARHHKAGPDRRGQAERTSATHLTSMRTTSVRRSECSGGAGSVDESLEMPHRRSVCRLLRVDSGLTNCGREVGRASASTSIAYSSSRAARATARERAPRRTWLTAHMLVLFLARHPTSMPSFLPAPPPLPSDDASRSLMSVCRFLSCAWTRPGISADSERGELKRERRGRTSTNDWQSELVQADESAGWYSVRVRRCRHEPMMPHSECIEWKRNQPAREVGGWYQHRLERVGTSRTERTQATHRSTGCSSLPSTRRWPSRCARSC